MDQTQWQAQFRETEAGLNHSIAELSHALGPLAPRDNGETLKVSYLPSWRGAYDADSLQVRNGSGADLQNALLFVTITGGSGESLTHLEAVDEWARDANLSVQYLYGASEYANSQTLEQPARIDVMVITHSGIERGDYELTPREWDTRVREYLSRVTFQASYLAPASEAETGKRLGPGFQFSFSGLRKLPVREATIRFLKGGQFEDSVWNLSAVEPDKVYVTRVDLASEPETAELTLRFEDSAVTVTLPSGGPARFSQASAPQPQAASQ